MTYCEFLIETSISLNDIHVQSVQIIDQSTLCFCLQLLMINGLVHENLNLVLFLLHLENDLQISCSISAYMFHIC